MRSQFLTLLCVLTFLSAGWGLIESGIALLNPDAVAETARTGYRPAETEKKKDDPTRFYDNDSANSDLPMPDDPDVVQRLALGQFIYSLLTGLGALLMFFLRRIGYFVYVAGIVAGLAIPMAFLGVAGLYTQFGTFFSVLFAVLYAYCWREMK